MLFEPKTTEVGVKAHMRAKQGDTVSALGFS
jgi:hypothetical protein